MFLRMPFGGLWMRHDALLDRFLAAVLLPLVLALMGLLWLILVPVQGRPFLYASERMRGPGRAFMLYKIRTMHPPDRRSEESVLGGDLAGRVTQVGRVLRRYRLDELPQILNVLKGEIRFIGPRPPLRKYVEAYPGLYREVLAVPPGITGLATVTLHAREERILARCRTAAETDIVYRRRCLPVKARLDLIYRDNRGPALDAWILYRTVAGLRGGGRTAQRAAPHPVASAAAALSLSGRSSASEVAAGVAGRLRRAPGSVSAAAAPAPVLTPAK